MAIAKKIEKITQKSKPAKTTKIKLVEKEDTDALRNKMISEAAYFRAEKRNFQNGDANMDWLAAEHEINNLINNTQLN